jgi:hypothetical protein
LRRNQQFSRSFVLLSLISMAPPPNPCSSRVAAQQKGQGCIRRPLDCASLTGLSSVGSASRIGGRRRRILASVVPFSVRRLLRRPTPHRPVYLQSRSIPHNADFVRNGVFTPPYPMVQIETPAKLSIAY